MRVIDRVKLRSHASGWVYDQPIPTLPGVRARVALKFDQWWCVSVDAPREHYDRYEIQYLTIGGLVDRQTIKKSNARIRPCIGLSDLTDNGRRARVLRVKISH